MRRYRDIARIAGKKGLDGHVVVEPNYAYRRFFEAGCDSVLIGMEFHFVPPRIDVPRHAMLRSIRSSDGLNAILSFDGIDGPDPAEDLAGMHCLVEETDSFPGNASDLSDADLVGEDGIGAFIDMMMPDAFAGWTVIDEITDSEYRVTESSSPAGQILLSVTEADEDGVIKLIPLAGDLIADVDAENHLIVMRLPAGLMDL